MTTVNEFHLFPSWLRNHPSAWNTNTLDREALYAQAKLLRHNPKFNEAKHKFADNMLAAFEHHMPLNRLLRGEGDLAFLAFVLSLHHNKDADNPVSGASYSKVLELFALLNIGSPTLVKALLTLARIRGYLSVEHVPHSRTKLLVPTDKLLATLQVWLRANLSAVNIIFPLPLSPLDLSAEPQILYKIFNYGINAYVHNQFILSESFPPVRAFMARNHGYLVLMAIISTAYKNADGEIFASVPSEDMAKRLSVSSGTVRNMIKQAKLNGWIVAISKGYHQIQLSDEFAELCDDWMSMELLWMGGVVKAAWFELSATNLRRDTLKPRQVV